MASTSFLKTVLLIFSCSSVVALAGCSDNTSDGAPGSVNGTWISDNGGDASGSNETGAQFWLAETTEFTAQLLMIEGHLQAGTDLYGMNDRAMAATHMKHPADEIYTKIAPGFAVYGHPGLERELAELAEAVASGASVEEVVAKFEAVQAAIASAVEACNLTTAQRLMAVVDVLGEAALEFDAAIDDGAVINAHEYQDAYGFMASAERFLAASGDDLTGKEKDTVDEARAIVAQAQLIASSVSPPEIVVDEAETIADASRRIAGLSASLQ